MMPIGIIFTGYVGKTVLILSSPFNVPSKHSSPEGAHPQTTKSYFAKYFKRKIRKQMPLFFPPIICRPVDDTKRWTIVDLFLSDKKVNSVNKLLVGCSQKQQRKLSAKMLLNNRKRNPG